MSEKRRLTEALPDASPTIGDETLERSAPTVEQLYGMDLDDGEFANHRFGVSLRLVGRSYGQSRFGA